MNMNPITVAEALPIVADKLGLNVQRDRCEVLDALNRIREHEYHHFDDARLFDDFLDCVPLECFHAPCSGRCGCEMYLGFVVGAGVAGPVAAWFNGRPLDLRSRWREKHTGINNTGCLDLIELPGAWPTRKDLPRSGGTLSAYSAADDGVTMTIHGEDCSGAERVICLVLEEDSTVVADPKLKTISSVTFDRPLTGGVDLLAHPGGEGAKGYPLSSYGPADGTVPSYRRFKVLTPCGCDPCNECNCCGHGFIYLQANREFRELCFDNEVVEIGSRLVLEAGASYLKWGQNTTDQRELQRAELDLARMFQFISKMRKRYRGGHIQDGPQINRRNSRRTRRAGLPGYNY